MKKFALKGRFKDPFHTAVVVFILAYIVVAFLVIGDYGITMDSQDDFGIGLKYLNYYTTGHLRFDDNLPLINGHPLIYGRTSIAKSPFYAYPFANILSAITCRVFYEKTHILDPVSAHHIVIPLLVAGFLYALYRFARKHWNSKVAFLSVLLLILYPRFFGDSFNNVKDVPLAIFFSLTIMLYVEWRTTWRPQYLYLAAVCFACAFTTKPDVVFAGVIVALWELCMIMTKARDARLWHWRTLTHVAVAAVAAVVIVWGLYPPLHPWNPDCRRYLVQAVSYMQGIGTWPDVSWNLYAPSYVLYATPVCALVLFGVGLVMVFSRLRSNAIFILLVIWVLFPVLRHCLPRMNHYDGMRHFLMFAVPFSIVVALGMTAAVAQACRLLGGRKGVAFALYSLCLAPEVYAIASTHPFETTYFNCLIGGLKGAQQSDYPYACDYWVNSYRQVGKWLDSHAQPDANYYAVVGTDLLRWSTRRADLHEIRTVNTTADIPHNTYLVVIPRKRWGGLVVQWGIVRKWMFIASVYQRVCRIERQGGEIVSIYYNP